MRLIEIVIFTYEKQYFRPKVLLLVLRDPLDNFFCLAYINTVCLIPCIISAKEKIYPCLAKFRSVGRLFQQSSRNFEPFPSSVEQLARNAAVWHTIDQKE